MNSTIFFNDMTVIDYSYITADGRLIGASATLNLEVSGPIESHEGVVIDFSAGKKEIKSLIDGPSGFDHKCWINVNDPLISISNETDTYGKVMMTVTHAASGLSITAEEQAFSWIDSQNPADDIRDFLNDCMHPFVVSSVSLDDTIIPVPTCDTSSHIFRYVHGLKYSSSYGCKNLVHGHKSFISGRFREGANKFTADRVLASIAYELDGTIFAHSEDLTSDRGRYTIEYSTPERGPMSMTFMQKLIVLETQTTVEHLVEYIRARYYHLLQTAGIAELYVSEGLCKGAKISI